jgi:hypothetical protein
MMKGTPVDLDAHRSPDNRIEVAFRRQGSKGSKPEPRLLASRRDLALHAQSLLAPADSWKDACCKLAFLIDDYATTAEAKDPRIQTLIRRALGDLARLTRREERKQ